MAPNICLGSMSKSSLSLQIVCIHIVKSIDPTFVSVVHIPDLDAMMVLNMYIL